jgi:hypothetical protein
MVREALCRLVDELIEIAEGRCGEGIWLLIVDRDKIKFESSRSTK